MLIIFVLFLLAIDVDLHIAIPALVYLFPCRDVELVEGKDDSLQVLTVLHPIDEVSADDVRLVREWIVWTVDRSIGLFLTEDLLVALRTSDVLGVCVGVSVLDEVKLNVVIAEVVDTVEAPVEDLGSSLECMESDIEAVASAEHHQVPHLTTVCSYFLRQVIWSIIDSQAVKRTVSSTIEKVEIPELESYSLARISDKLVATLDILRISSWVGWGEEISGSVPAFVSVAPDGESTETVLPHSMAVWDTNFCVFILRNKFIMPGEPCLG